MGSKYLADPYMCYLTSDAAKAMAVLEKAGLDKDLALSVLEDLWKEEDIYALEEAK